MPDQLTVNWPYLLMAIATLWFPRQWLRSGARVLKKRRKPDGAMERLAGIGARDPDDKSVQPGREFANARNYIDLFRALAGGYSLSQFAFTLGADADEVLGVLANEGIGKALAKRALELAQAQGRFTIFAVVDALTRLAGECRNAGDRLQADQQAARLLQLAAV